MKLSSGWEQSVYVLLILARFPDNRSMNSIMLADRLCVSQSYLKKIIKLLVNEGLITSTTGKNGGFSLAKPLNEITFYDVFLAIEGRGKIFQSQQLLKNFLGSESDKAKPCAITNALDTIENTLVKTLSAITLEQVEKETQANYELKDLDRWIWETNHPDAYD
ncbi:Rrf2 family transcriptional regulator [Lactococcus hircilactis]|uniref:Rrf2 family transcriptional regulator n=1 Tax=Lactococcus hircilactis TaxID=1494462 RepID=A0A7X2D077_9LACT|nr:Rrf2 family transcriptional regulator [Lactococcus hircilactis]MQW39113.1 Rrf2 family transcriptional regulator [Lactococcus hircilactis]